MKKIGILLSSPKEIGGIFQYSLSIISSLENFERKKIFNVKYFYTDKEWSKHIPKNSRKVLIKKFFLIRIFRKVLNYFFKNNIELYKRFEFLNEEVSSINSSDCDLIIFPSQNLVSYLVNKTSLSTIHDLMHIYEPKFEEYDEATIFRRNVHYQSICKYCDGILVDSKLGKKHVKDNFIVKKSKIFILPFVVPSYINKKIKIDVKKKFRINKKYLFYPAQFWEHKNHLNVVKAFSYFKKENDDFALVFCGAKKNFYNQVKEMSDSLGLSKDIYFLGRVKDRYMRSLYENAELTIFASFCGPTNIPPLEAIAIGSPLVCSNVYSMTKQVNKAAIFFDPKDPKDLYKKIKILNNDKKLKYKISQQGKMLIQEYNQKHFNNLLKSYIKKLLN